MKKIVLMIILCLLFTDIFGQEPNIEAETEVEAKAEAKTENVSLLMLFHDIGWNALHSITYNYGLNYIGAGLGTWAIIESGIDWKWNRLAYNNSWMPSIGGIANYVGYAVPVLTPLTFYFTGLIVKDQKLQLTGMALTQALLLTLAIQTPLKIIAGRTWPGIVDGWDSPLSKRSYRTDDYSGEFNWFNLDAIGGWPSGHTANAFTAAATLAQIYHDNILVKVIAFSYAALVGLGMSIYDHWASDVFAGALIGYAVGTTVGKSYRKYMEKKENENKITFYATGNSFGLIILM